MAYTEEKKAECFDWIISEIESGRSLISAINTNGMPSTKTFYQWLEEEDGEKGKRYARACEMRELLILDQMMEIADKQGQDVIETDNGHIINHNVIQRNKLQIETRQWLLGKLRPEKYGNKTILAGDSEKPIKISFED